MALLFVAAHVIALLRLLWARFPYPWFLLALAVWTAQAANVGFWQGTTREWVATWWLYPEIAVVLTTAAATVEAIERERRAANGFAGLQLRVASIGIPACLVGLGWRFVAPPAGDPLSVFTGARVWVWAYLALSLGIVVLLVGLKAKNRPALHSCLLLAVLFDHAMVAPFAAVDHPGWRAAYRWTLGACLVIWASYYGGRRVPRE